MAASADALHVVMNQFSEACIAPGARTHVRPYRRRGFNLFATEGQQGESQHVGGPGCRFVASTDGDSAGVERPQVVCPGDVRAPWRQMIALANKSLCESVDYDEQGGSEGQKGGGDADAMSTFDRGRTDHFFERVPVSNVMAGGDGSGTAIDRPSPQAGMSPDVGVCDLVRCRSRPIGMATNAGDVFPTEDVPGLFEDLSINMRRPRDADGEPRKRTPCPSTLDTTACLDANVFQGTGHPGEDAGESSRVRGPLLVSVGTTTPILQGDESEIGRRPTIAAPMTEEEGDVLSTSNEEYSTQGERSDLGHKPGETFAVTSRDNQRFSSASEDEVSSGFRPDSVPVKVGIEVEESDTQACKTGKDIVSRPLSATERQGDRGSSRNQEGSAANICKHVDIESASVLTAAIPEPTADRTPAPIRARLSPTKTIKLGNVQSFESHKIHRQRSVERDGAISDTSSERDSVSMGLCAAKSAMNSKGLSSKDGSNIPPTEDVIQSTSPDAKVLHPESEDRNPDVCAETGLGYASSEDERYNPSVRI